MISEAAIYTIILIFSNIVLLCAGLTVFILGVKMQLALSVLSLVNIPAVNNVVNAVTTTGVFISVCSLSGLVGACGEYKHLLFGHVISLGIIVIMEFSVGLSLMIIKKSVSEAVESSDCNNVCAANFDAAILNYAVPSTGVMMSIIFVEAAMIYCAFKLYLIIRDRQRLAPGPPIAAQNLVMQNVIGTRIAYVASPTASSSPMPSHSQLDSIRQEAGTIRRSQSNIEDRPPDYESLTHIPVMYACGSMGASTSTEQPKDTDDFSLV